MLFELFVVNFVVVHLDESMHSNNVPLSFHEFLVNAFIAWYNLWRDLNLILSVINDTMSCFEIFESP